MVRLTGLKEALATLAAKGIVVRYGTAYAHVTRSVERGTYECKENKYRYVGGNAQ